MQPVASNANPRLAAVAGEADAGSNRTDAKAHLAVDATATVRVPFDRMKASARRAPNPSYAERMDRLGRLLDVVRKNQTRIEEAASADFGGRSRHETRMAEIFMTISSIKYARSHLKSWMKPSSRSVGMAFMPARAKVHYQPVGVVGIIAPWNYPFQLAVEPAVYAIAAGNRVLIKPSEYTPHTAELMKSLLAEVCDPDVVGVVTGGPDVGEAFTHLPFDHLLFTGSTQVGRMVMRAAAENLVPVTLELGGKSPTIVHESYPVERAAARIVAGKWFNAGQTCIAPDYLLVAESKKQELMQSIITQTQRAYPTLSHNPDYTSIVSDRHYKRLRALVADAEEQGARKTEINPAREQFPESAHRLPPTLLTDVSDDMKVMQEEIFGPVLPIVGYRSLDEAIDYVNAHPRPLALYYFDHNGARARDLLERTVSGGAAVNETVLHFGVDDMPFGGVGPSGMGAYHGKEGFDTFSHKKGVLYQSRYNTAGLMSPPYGATIDRLLKLLIGQ